MRSYLTTSLAVLKSSMNFMRVYLLSSCVFRILSSGLRTCSCTVIGRRAIPRKYNSSYLNSSILLRAKMAFIRF